MDSEFGMLTILLLCGAAFVTAILHSIAGFAGALLMSITIAPLIGVKLTVPIVSVAMVISHGSRIWVFRDAVDWRTFRLLSLSALPFILLGVYTYVSLSEAAVGLLLGSLLLITVPLQRFLKGRQIKIPHAAIAVVAVPYGFLSGASFGVGMILGPFLLGAGLSGEVLIATLAVQGFVLNVIKTIAFGLSPLLSANVAMVGVLMGLCTFPGHYVGRLLLRRTPVSLHTGMLELYLMLGAMYFISRWWLADS